MLNIQNNTKNKTQELNHQQKIHLLNKKGEQSALE